MEKSYTTTTQKKHPASSNLLATKKLSSPAKKGDSKTPFPDNNISGTVKETSNTVGQSADTESAPQTKSKKNKKKKKKGGKKSSSKQPIRQEEILEEMAEKTVVESKPAPSPIDSQSSVSASLLDFWRSFLLPFAMAIISLIMSLATSMFAGNKKKSGKKKRG